MKKKIFSSIMLVAGVVLACSLVIIMSAAYEYFTAVQSRELDNQLALAAAGVEESGLDYLEGLPERRNRLTWVAADGTVLYDTDANAADMDNHANRAEIRQALESEEGLSVRYSATLLRRTIYYAERLSDGTVLRISAHHASVWLLIVGMFQPILAVLIAALVLSIVLAGRVSRKITEPLNRLNLDEPQNNDTYEELTPLLTRLGQQHRQIGRQLRELRRKSDEFDQITAHMGEGLVLLNERGVILAINHAAAQVFHPHGSCVGEDFLTVERSPGVTHAVQTALSDGHGEVRLERDSRELQIEVSAIESDGAIIGAVLLVFDVTAQAVAERTRREFTANVSHELKTPLQAIMGSAELIENGLVREEDLPRFVGHIRTESERLLSLINDIIRLSQLDEKTELPTEDVELRALCEEVLHTLALPASDKGVTLTLEGEELHYCGVRQLLHEIVYNLCDNAVKYNKVGGSVTVTLALEGKNAVLTVADTGIGIPASARERIFERFYRVDKSHSRRIGGTGLGLSIVKHAVGYMDGRITLESEPDRGTVITVTLPTA